MSDPSLYGTRYWVVERAKAVDPDEESSRYFGIYGNRLEVNSIGVLVVWGANFEKEVDNHGRLTIHWDKQIGEEYPVMILAPGEWKEAYAASLLTGSPVAMAYEQ